MHRGGQFPLSLLSQFPECLRIPVLLRSTQGSAKADDAVNHLGPVGGKDVDGPCARGRFGQSRYFLGEVLVPCVLGFPGEGRSPGGELLGQYCVQLLGSIAEIHAFILGFWPQRSAQAGQRSTWA